MRVKVKGTERYEIFYDSDRKEFSAEVGGFEVVFADTQEKVEVFAEKYVTKQHLYNYIGRHRRYQGWIYTYRDTYPTKQEAVTAMMALKNSHPTHSFRISEDKSGYHIWWHL